MTTEQGRTTRIADLDQVPVASEVSGGKKEGGGVVCQSKAFLASLDWPMLLAVAAAAFTGQKVPLDQAIARFPWAFQMGPVPVRSVIVAILFALVHAFWLRK